MQERREQFQAIMATLTRAGDLALTPTAERLEAAFEGLDASRPLWTSSSTPAEAEQLRNEIHRIRALAEQAKRIFGALAQLSCPEDTAPANYRPDGTLSTWNPNGELLLHG